MLELPQFPAKLKLRLGEAARRLRLTRSAGRLLEELVDNPRSRAWSNDRLAVSLRFHLRTIELAMAELRAHGFISMEYRRRMTAIKHICVEAILEAVKNGVEVAKRKASRAIAMIRQGFQAPQRIAGNIHRLFNDGPQSDDWRVQRPPCASLLRSLGMPVTPIRR